VKSRAAHAVTTAIPDEELVVAAKASDRNAFAELWNRHAPGVYRLVYRVLRNREDTEDAPQESFFKAFTHIADFKGDAKFSTWMTRIAINTALGELRRRRSRPSSTITLLCEDDLLRYMDTPDTSVDIEKAYEVFETVRRIRQAIDRLRPDQRQLIQLKHRYDCSNKELAELAGMTVPKVKSVLHRANKSLRSICGHSVS